MSNGDVIGMAVMALILSVIVIAVNWHESTSTEKQRIECEARGGSLLDHTTKVGRFEDHAYICVDSKLILKP